MKEKTPSRKILIFSTAYLPFVGGAEVSVKEITDTLTDYEYELITARFDRTLPAVEKIGSITVYRLGVGIPLLDKLLLPFWGALKAIHLSLRKDYVLFWVIMISFSGGAAYITNIVRALIGKPKVPVVLTLQEGDSEEHLQYRWAGLLYFSSTLALRYADTVTALSTFLIQRAKNLGFSGEAVLVPNGVNLALFSKPVDPHKRDVLLDRYAKKTDDIFLITVSRLVKKNAVDDCIRSLAYMPSRVRLLILGVGEDMPSLIELVKKLGLSERVHFVGFVSHAELPVYFSIADVFVRPSRSEGFGNSFIEAMASRLPVIATPVGGIPDFVDDKETGIFCAPDNPKSIAEAVQYILEHPAETTHMIEKAFVRVNERYAWQTVTKQMQQVFTRYT